MFLLAQIQAWRLRSNPSFGSTKSRARHLRRQHNRHWQSNSWQKLFSSLQTYMQQLEYSIVNQIPSNSFVTANQKMMAIFAHLKLGASASLIPEITVLVEGTYGAFNHGNTLQRA